MKLLLIDRQTAAATSFPFKVSIGSNPALTASGLAGAETVTLQVLTGDSWDNAKNSSGADITLTATSPQHTILAEGTYRVVKTSTAAATTVQKG